MNANDARIVRLFTAQVDGTVEDDTPNAKAHVPFQFDLILQAEVGAVLGDSGANYTLDLHRHQRRHGDPPGLPGTPEGNPFREEWSAAYGWSAAATISSRPARARPTASCATASTSPSA